jgi:hypothetical protein
MRRNRLLRGTRPFGLAVAILLVLAGGAGAGVGVWTLTGVPLTATQYALTTFTLTVTDLSLLDEIGCVVVNATSSFSVSSVGVGNASNGRAWVGSHTSTTFTVHSLDGGGRLQAPASLTFTVDATPLASGIHSWSAVAYRQQDCSGSVVAGIPAVTITVLAGTPTPTPQPTPSASPRATPRPSGSSTPMPGQTASAVPSVLPSASFVASSRPVASGAVVNPPGAGPSGGSGGPSAGPTSASQAGTPGLSSDTAPGAVSAGGLAVPQPDGEHLTVGGSGTNVGLGGFVVPVTVFGVPALFILLWVALQVAGGVIWLPAARRVRGGGGTEEPNGAR